MLVIPKEIMDNWVLENSLDVSCNGTLLKPGVDYKFIYKSNSYKINFFIKITTGDRVNLFLNEKPFPSYNYEHLGLDIWNCISNHFSKPKTIGKITSFNPKSVGKTSPPQIFEIGKIKGFSLDDEFNLYPEPKKSLSEFPKNNDGRTSCFWCGSPTKQSQGFSEMYDICTSCGK